MTMSCMGAGFIGTAMMLRMAAIAVRLLAALVLAILAFGKYVFFR